MRRFDAYLMVDWSAHSKPKTGRDSVWYCLVTYRGCLPAVTKTENPRTRHHAVRQIGDLLAQLIGQRMAMLVGFDFPYGYPVGFATALGLAGKDAWHKVWECLSSEIEDEPNNENNRFEVAAQMNARISGREFPFWGHPPGRKYENLKPTRPLTSRRIHLPHLRLTDERIKGPQSAWKLWGAGSVGSQALLGFPQLNTLRNHPRLAAHSLVWPFETGLHCRPKNSIEDPLILHVEIFPAMLKATPAPGEVRDEVQVRNLAMYFAEADERGELPRWLAGPTDLTDEEKGIVVTEEGWILGIEACSRAN